MNLNSLDNFKKSIDRTYNLHSLFKKNVDFTNSFIEYFNVESIAKEKSQEEKKRYENILNLRVPDEIIQHFSEISFVAMFSNYEYFTVELLKELWVKYPKSMNFNCEIQFNEIKDFSSIKKQKEYIVDKEANIKSNNIKEWGKYIKETYGLDPFKYKDGTLLHGLLHMSQIRDSIMHSGGKVSSILLSKLNKNNYTGEKYKLGDKYLKKYSNEKIFYILSGLLEMLHKNIEAWVLSK